MATRQAGTCRNVEINQGQNVDKRNVFFIGVTISPTCRHRRRNKQHFSSSLYVYSCLFSLFFGRYVVCCFLVFGIYAARRCLRPTGRECRNAVSGFTVDLYPKAIVSLYSVAAMTRCAEVNPGRTKDSETKPKWRPKKK